MKILFTLISSLFLFLSVSEAKTDKKELAALRKEYNYLRTNTVPNGCTISSIQFIKAYSASNPGEYADFASIWPLTYKGQSVAHAVVYFTTQNRANSYYFDIEGGIRPLPDITAATPSAEIVDIIKKDITRNWKNIEQDRKSGFRKPSEDAQIPYKDTDAGDLEATKYAFSELKHLQAHPLRITSEGKTYPGFFFVFNNSLYVYSPKSGSAISPQEVVGKVNVNELITSALTRSVFKDPTFVILKTL